MKQHNYTISICNKAIPIISACIRPCLFAVDNNAIKHYAVTLCMKVCRDINDVSIFLSKHRYAEKKVSMSQPCPTFCTRRQLISC